MNICGIVIGAHLFMPIPSNSNNRQRHLFRQLPAFATLIALTVCGATAAHAATYTWVGTTSTLFDTATNWLPAGVPQTGDTVIVNTNATLNVGKNLTLGRLSLGAGSVLQGAGALTVTSYLSSQNALLDGTGPLYVSAGATADFSNSTVPTAKSNRCKKTVYNSGTLNVLSGNLVLTSDFVNDLGATLNIGSDGSITRDTAVNPVFKNKGTLVKSFGAGTSGITTAFQNTGVVRSQSGTLDLGPNYTQTDGVLTLDGGDLSASGPINILGGKLAGTGTINGNVINDINGHVGPGHSPGSLIINGNYTQTGNGSLDIEIGGTSPGTQFDKLTIKGTAYLNGMLNIVQYNGYLPVAGSNFEILDYYTNAGNFSTVNFQFPGSPLAFSTSLSPIYLIATASKPDPALPTAAVTNPASRAVVTTLSSSNGTASGANTVKSVTVQLYRYGNSGTASGFWGGSSTWSTAYSPTANERAATGTTSWSIAMPTLAYGEYSIRPTAKDGLGKSSLADSVHFFKSAGSSSYGVSTTTAKSSTNSIQLKFTGALDTKYAVDLSHYDVLRVADGMPLSVQSIGYSANTTTVTLNLLAGSIKVGDKVTVTTRNMFDSKGNIMKAQATTVTAN